MRIALLVPFGFALGAVACAMALRGAPTDLRVDLAQPLVVVTYWRSFGALMWSCLFLGIAVASVGYALLLRRLRSTSLTAIALVAAVACVCALAFPVVFSSDVYAYAGYGDMALRGIDPYSHARVFVRDPLLDAMVWQWGNPPPMCVYGPAFVSFVKIIDAALLPFGAAAPLWALRIAACAALVSCVPLAYAAFAPFTRERRLLAAAGIALNPIAIWSCAEGHNDVYVLAIALAGFALASRARPFAGALTVTLAALIKAPALVAAGAFALFSLHDVRAKSRVAWGTALGVFVVAAIALPLEIGVRTHLLPGGQYAPQFSPQYALSTVLPMPAAIALTFTACGAAIVAGLRRLYRGHADGGIAVALAAYLALPNPYPWYALWILPTAFLATARASEAMWAIVAASLLAVFRYYGDATTNLTAIQSLAVVAMQCGVPLAVLMGGRMYRVRRDRRENRTPVPGFATSRNS